MELERFLNYPEKSRLKNRMLVSLFRVKVQILIQSYFVIALNILSFWYKLWFAILFIANTMIYNRKCLRRTMVCGLFLSTLLNTHTPTCMHIHVHMIQCKKFFSTLIFLPCTTWFANVTSYQADTPNIVISNTAPPNHLDSEVSARQDEWRRHPHRSPSLQD